MERDGESNQRNDTLPGTKTRNKKPIGTKKKNKKKKRKKKNRERTPRSNSVYRAQRIRALD